MTATILIVDDSSFARASLRRILKKADYTVIEAKSGEEALEKASSEQPDVITLDLLMPQMSGQETLQKLYPICPQAKFIIITADIQEQTQSELLAAGAHAFLNKPISSKNMLNVLNELLSE